VIPVPPSIDPEAGATLVTVGGATNVKAFVRVPVCASGFVTVTSTAPAACAGVEAVIVVALLTFTLVGAAPPTVTVAPAANPAPVMVMFVPPAIGPDAGDTLLRLTVDGTA
jgi:hypothetical protein